MIRKFLCDRGGNYAMMMGIAMLPIMGSVAIAIDFSEMNRQKQATINALDAAGVATARQIVSGASEEALIAYANDFFQANLGPVDPADTQLTVQLPSNQYGGGTLKLSAVLNYKPYFLPTFHNLLGTPAEDRPDEISFVETSEIRLKNTLEVALVLDNSGSMSEDGSGSGEKRLTLLKAAAKQLVDTLALQAAQVKQVAKPVQFSLVPFAASVNVGPANADAAWMDVEGLSPVHHENFDWTRLDDAGKGAQQVGGIWYKKGSGWGAEENGVLSRFSLYRDMRMVSDREWVVTGQEWVCTRWWENGSCRRGEWRETGYYDETISTYASWQGCVEARPYPYNVNDAPAQGGTANTGIGFGDPATMFVPMFAPDEPGDRWDVEGETRDNLGASNNWWNDGTESISGQTRQKNMKKYFEVRPYGATSPQGSGPSYSCTATPITPLTDVTTEEGLATIKGAIDRMNANGNTNIPEGTAWGWRTISSTAPFTEGRPESEKGNDKVIIVLTDGANTYSVPSKDPAGNKSTYAAYGYTGVGYNGTGTTRMFMGTSGAIGQYDYSSSNYTSALDEQMEKVCDNAKAANVLVMTVSLDLSTSIAGENKAIEAMKKCASDSRFRRDPSDPTKPAKLYWNATGSNLADKFKEIADELSNLRIVG
ncbi:pilus assembly protein TadG-related protein [Mesorhizobium sp. ZMM04-5]|uniref:Pilus assembly protein TadG-related protein n=1 Tax=Mesorhizobium marinum TaxID=3228790 RepID=A0ABV3R0X2_9HYPH